MPPRPIQSDPQEPRFLEYPYGVSGNGTPNTTTAEKHLRDLILQILFTNPVDRTIEVTELRLVDGSQGFTILSTVPGPLPVRLARRLCALASDFGSEVHISQEQLGVFVGAARESVNRQLLLWRKDGILDLQRGRVLLLNMSKLTAVARNE